MEIYGINLAKKHFVDNAKKYHCQRYLWAQRNSISYEEFLSGWHRNATYAIDADQVEAERQWQWLRIRRLYAASPRSYFTHRSLFDHADESSMAMLTTLRRENAGNKTIGVFPTSVGMNRSGTC